MASGGSTSSSLSTRWDSWPGLPSPASSPGWPIPTTSPATSNARARAYLQVNCSHCHQFNAGGTANIALGIEVPLAETKTVGVRPIQGTFNIPGARIIAPGEPERSVLYYRISKLGGGRMPRVGSNQVDERATRLIHDWIAGMRPTEKPAAGRGPQGRCRRPGRPCEPETGRRSRIRGAHRGHPSTWPPRPMGPHAHDLARPHTGCGGAQA